MSILDKVNAEAQTMYNLFFDKEPLNYLEAAGLYVVTAQGRFNVVSLQILYNHATNGQLKNLIKEAIDEQTKSVMNDSEQHLQEGGGTLPSLHFAQRKLHDTPLSIPDDARLTDKEIALALTAMAKASQTALLTAMHQCYQLNVAMTYRKILERGLDWNYKLLQLMLNQGWLPHMAKVEH